MVYNMKKHLRHSEAHAERGLLLFRAVAFAVCAMFAVLYAQTPLYADDLWYLEGMKPQTSGFRAFVACLHTVGRHWLHDTGRLANLICPPFLTLMPKWVYGIMIAAAIYVLIDYGRRISQAPPLSVRAGLWLVAVVFAFPWLDCMLSVVFSLNYVLPAAMSAVLVWYLLQGVHGRRYGLACHGVCFGQRVAAFRRQGGVPRECAAQQHAPGAHTCRRRTVGNALSGTQLHRRRRLAVCMAPPPCLVHRQDSPCRRCPQGGAVAPWRECDSAEKNDSPRRLPRAVALFFFPADDYLPKKRL